MIIPQPVIMDPMKVIENPMNEYQEKSDFI